ncbi:MAG TPA: hypothetical protein VEJ46_15485 [Candidatus Acidoferrum sp.]|nr:hypothetical protein [Candidatus Acidoferrum sp.]
MSKIVGLACFAMLLLSPANSVDGRFAKYRPIEAYEVRPGILMMPSYSGDGQVCEVGLEQRQYSPEMVRLDPSLTREDVDRIFQELVPADERGAKLNELISENGVSITTIEDFQNVSLLIYGQNLSTPHSHKIVERNVAAVVRWKNRKCQ